MKRLTLSLACCMLLAGCGHTQQLGPGTILKIDSGEFIYRTDDGKLWGIRSSVTFSNQLKGMHCESFSAHVDDIGWVEEFSATGCTAVPQ